MTAANKILERRARVWEQAKGLADSAADENRNFTAEEQASWDGMNAEIDALDKRAQEIQNGEKRAHETEARMASLDGASTAEGRAQLAKPENDQLRAFLRGETRSRRYDVAPSGTSFRDLTKGTATAGGNTVPTSFYDQLVEHMIENSAILQAKPTVLNTASGEDIEVPKTTAHPDAALFAEGAALTENDATFGQITLGAFKYGRLIQVSRELIEDTAVDLQGYLAKSAGAAVGNAFGTHMVTGTGTGQPRGVVTDATLGKTGPTGTTVTFGSQNAAGEGFDLLIDLYHSVISPYRRSPSCGWLMSDTTAAVVRKIKDADGRYAWQPSVVVGQPDTILSKPVHVDPNVADPAANAKSLLFGDFSQYFVRFAGGVRFERSDDFAFANDLVTFRVIQRADAALVDLTGAVKYFAHSAT